MKNYWKLLRLFCELATTLKLAHCVSWVLLFFNWFFLRTNPFETFVRIYKRMSDFVPTYYLRKMDDEMIMNIVTRTAKFTPFQSTCLIKTLTAKMLFQNRNDIQLKIGVSKINGFEAHAWLEKKGETIMEQNTRNSWIPLWTY
jgi:hypothetical protein